MEGSSKAPKVESSPRTPEESLPRSTSWADDSEGLHARLGCLTIKEATALEEEVDAQMELLAQEDTGQPPVGDSDPLNLFTADNERQVEPHRCEYYVTPEKVGARLRVRDIVQHEPDRACPVGIGRVAWICLPVRDPTRVDRYAPLLHVVMVGFSPEGVLQFMSRRTEDGSPTGIHEAVAIGLPFRSAGTEIHQAEASQHPDLSRALDSFTAACEAYQDPQTINSCPTLTQW